MNQESKKQKKSKPESKGRVRDLQPKKDAKGGTSLSYGKIEVTYTPQKP